MLMGRAQGEKATGSLPCPSAIPPKNVGAAGSTRIHRGVLRARTPWASILLADSTNVYFRKASATLTHIRRTLIFSAKIMRAPTTRPIHGQVSTARRRRFGAPAGCRQAGGFTLIELLIVISIIGVLVSLVLPMASRAVSTARGFKCQSGLRNIAYDFTVFADENLHGPRGSSAGPGRFRLEAFQDSEYCVNEFWCWDGEAQHLVPDLPGNDPLRCPEVRGPLVLRANAPCTSGGVSPPQNVSYGFNIRLDTAERLDRSPPAVRIELTSRILQETNVPLVWDIDGQDAVSRGSQPFFSGPSLDSPLVFAGDMYWFPALRHVGQLNVAFIDGHVAASRRPLDEPTWRWGFSPLH